MSASTNYDIITTIKVADQATAATRAINAQTAGMTGSMFRAVTGANLASDAIMRFAERGVQAVKSFVSEIVSMNKAFEDQSIKLAALINAYQKYYKKNGELASPSENFKASKGMAASQMGSFERAERNAPITKELMAEMASAVMPYYLGAGGKLGEQLTALVSKAGTAGKLSVQGEESSPQSLLRILMGKAQPGRNGIAQVLGINAESFNKLSISDRLKELQKALDRVITPEMIEEQNKTFSVISQHFSNFIEDMKRNAGANIFERYKDTLSSFNAVLGANEEMFTGVFRNILDSGLSVVEMVFAPVVRWFKELGESFKALSKSQIEIKRLMASFEAMSATLRQIANATSAADAAMGGASNSARSFSQAISELARAVSIAVGVIRAGAQMLWNWSPGGLAGDANDIAGLINPAWGGHSTRGAAGQSLLNRFKSRVGYSQVTAGMDTAKRYDENFRKQFLPDWSKRNGGPSSPSDIDFSKTPVNNFTQNFNGGVTIKQEFKENADPDRIAFKVAEVFQKLKSNPISSPKRFSFSSM